jgi:hypothetical protein
MEPVRRQVERLTDRLPDEVVSAVKGSASRLAKVRSPKEAMEAIPTELEHLVTATVPVLAEHPLPITSARQARVWASAAAGASAVLQQAGEVSMLETLGLGTALAPGVLAGMLLSWVAELWLSVTVRVKLLEEDGRSVDHGVLATDMIEAVLGGPAGQNGDPRRRAARTLGRQAANRVGKRWAAGLVPVIGIVYDSWDAQRTIDRVLPLPLDTHPRAVRL